MTRYKLQDERSLGASFYAGKESGHSWFATKEELDLLWSLDEDTMVTSDNHWTGTVGELLDLFGNTNKLSDNQVDHRFGKGRSKTGLSLQTAVSDDGNLFLTR